MLSKPYARLELTLGDLTGTCSGHLHPSLRLDVDVFDADTETLLVQAATNMICAAFTAARRQQEIQRTLTRGSVCTEITLPGTEDVVGFTKSPQQMDYYTENACSHAEALKTKTLTEIAHALGHRSAKERAEEALQKEADTLQEKKPGNPFARAWGDLP